LFFSNFVVRNLRDVYERVIESFKLSSMFYIHLGSADQR